MPVVASGAMWSIPRMLIECIEPPIAVLLLDLLSVLPSATMAIASAATAKTSAMAATPERTSSLLSDRFTCPSLNVPRDGMPWL